jgi:hypothetical protein
METFCAAKEEKGVKNKKELIPRTRTNLISLND